MLTRTFRLTVVTGLWLAARVAGQEDLHPEVVELEGMHMPQRFYDQETEALKEKHMCRIYPGGFPSDICTDYCTEKKQNSNGTYSSTSLPITGKNVDGETTVIQHFDPDDNEYWLGRCSCKDLPLARDIIMLVIRALPAIAGIGCESLWDSFQTVMDFGSVPLPALRAGDESLKYLVLCKIPSAPRHWTLTNQTSGQNDRRK